MSGHRTITTTPTHYGPAFKTRLDLMGIRFNTNPDNTGAGAGGGAGGGNAYTPPATQEELNRIIGERVAREQAKFTDYDQLKTKAEQFDALERQRAAGAQGGQPGDQVAQQLAAFETRVAEAETKATTVEQTLATTQVELARNKVALDKGIGKEQLVLLTATTEDDLVKQADAIKALSVGTGRAPGQGGSGSGGAPAGLDAGRSAYQERHGKKNTQ